MLGPRANSGQEVLGPAPLPWTVWKTLLGGSGRMGLAVPLHLYMDIQLVAGVGKAPADPRCHKKTYRWSPQVIVPFSH